ncbi:MAG TPA: histidine--tRNA ligase, partial [Chitinophagaceae bacterium]
MFKVLNNGLDHPSKQQQAREEFEKVLAGKSVKGVTERALRYDLTIPFARYVAMNHGQLTFPFKRYQVQPVWRADRPQKGRYREFFQCDADVVGSTSLWNEVELASIYAAVFNQLKVPVTIRLNSRKILQGLAECYGGAGRMVDITTAIDKLDKIGIEKVKEELADAGLEASAIEGIGRYLLLEGSTPQKLEGARQLLSASAIAGQGVDDLTTIVQRLQRSGDCPVEVDLGLARGLNYYTGTIFEVKAVDVSIGSIGGGGRYDDLTGLFGVPNIPGVGISFGVDRIYDVMDELNLFPASVHSATDVLFFNLGEKECERSFELATLLRKNNVRCEVYAESARFDRQFKYAERKQIPYIVIIGNDEIANGTCKLKTLATGQQVDLTTTELLAFHFK